MFNTARFKLTAWYLAIIMTVTLAFSFIVYRILMNEVNRFAMAQRIRIENRWVPPGIPVPTVFVPDPDLVEELRRRIVLNLGLIDFGILVVSGGLGYFLAGRTLRPIRVMVDEQNRFISDASHELKTPLTSLKTSMEVFMRQQRPKISEAREVVSDGLSEIGRLQSLSESLLQLAQYQKPNRQDKYTPVSLAEVVGAAVKKIEPLASGKGISIETSGSDQTVMGSYYSLVDLLVILLDNAVKYSPSAAPVSLRIKKTDHSVDVSVADHGPGISAEDLPHIFDRFYRADTARVKSSGGGYGLGLAIAQKIAESHHGAITVDSRPGQGSVFSVRLPVSGKARR